ncbi:MAG TPA: hypothetical protein VK679_03260 [Gemmatimonadaceae bacterium]|jgi:hypothetical protein|nr:hypothetical protein [Gemmatimonadaceae bacterium]
MQALALIVVAAAGLWLVGVAVLMALRPRYCLHLLEKMSANLERSNWRLQFTEQGLRVLAGVALIVRAPATRLPLVFEVAGWLLVATSLLIMVAPIRWHGTYGMWWVKRLTPLMIRILSPVPAAVGVGLIYAAL